VLRVHEWLLPKWGYFIPDTKTVNLLRGLDLSPEELQEMNPKWPPAMIEAWLSMISSMEIIADLLDVEIDQKLEEIPTDFTNGSIPFVEGGKLIEDNGHLFWHLVDKILKVTGIVQSEGRVKNDVVVTLGMSPYNIAVSDETVYNDTDTGVILATLPMGVDGAALRVINSGTSGNKAWITPYGLQLLYGKNDSEFLIDLEHLDLQYSATKGWY